VNIGIQKLTGEIFTDHFIANLLLSASETILKICQYLIVLTKKLVGDFLDHPTVYNAD